MKNYWNDVLFISFLSLEFNSELILRSKFNFEDLLLAFGHKSDIMNDALTVLNGNKPATCRCMEVH